jgi:hypothetical protein
MNGPVEAPGLDIIRRLILLLLTVAMIGTAADLMLLDHHEGFWQMVPLGVIALGIVSVALTALKGGAGTVTLMRVTMALFICSGFVGMGLHYIGNNEFQLEMDPSLHGWSLFVKSITSKAPPALAPAAMIQMGLLGLLYTYKHPALGYSLQEAGSDGRRQSGA